MIAVFVRALLVRDVENTLADALGAEAALSKSTVSRACQAIAEEFEAWSSGRLDELESDYLSWTLPILLVARAESLNDSVKDDNSATIA